MTESDSTLLPLNSLPVSHRQLMYFNCLQHLRCRLLESVFIQPPSSTTIYGPEGNIFEYPTQIIILGIQKHHVDLGIYSHPTLLTRRGPLPRRRWRKNWKKASAQWGNTTQEPPHIPELHSLADECYDLISSHHLCYEALEGLLHQHDNDFDDYTLNGVRQLLHQLRKKDKAFYLWVKRLHESQSQQTTTDT